MTFSNGPLTGLLTACASAAAAGIVLGGLAAGFIGVLLSWGREDLDFRVRRAGFWGGAIGLAALLVDGAGG
ncbi:MAG: hypothetical protein WEB79_04320 [Thermoleophilaceae bacterium]